MPAGEYSSSEESKSSKSHRRKKIRSRASSSDPSSSEESSSSRSQKKRRHRSRSSSRSRDRRGDRRRREDRKRSPRRRRSRSKSRSVDRRGKKSVRSSSSRSPSPPPKQPKVKRNFKQERYDMKNDEIRQKFQTAEETSVSEQIRRANELEALETSSFSVQSFTSSRSEKSGPTSSDAGFGTEAVLRAATVKAEPNVPSPQSQNAASAQIDKESICHPNLFLNQEAKMQRWVEKLYKLRQNALKGRPLSS